MHDHLTFFYLFCFILSSQERSTLYFCFSFTFLIKYWYKSVLFDAGEAFIVCNWILFSIWWKQGNFHLLSSSFVFFSFCVKLFLLWGSFFGFFLLFSESRRFKNVSLNLYLRSSKLSCQKIFCLLTFFFVGACSKKTFPKKKAKMITRRTPLTAFHCFRPKCCTSVSKRETNPNKCQLQIFWLSTNTAAFHERLSLPQISPSQRTHVWWTTGSKFCFPGVETFLLLKLHQHSSVVQKTAPTVSTILQKKKGQGS